MFYCAGKLRGNILIQASAKHDINYLYTAANPQRRFVLIYNSLSEHIRFQLIPHLADFSAIIGFFLSIVIWMHIRTAGKQKAVKGVRKLF